MKLKALMIWGSCLFCLGVFAAETHSITYLNYPYGQFQNQIIGQKPFLANKKAQIFVYRSPIFGRAMAFEPITLNPGSNVPVDILSCLKTQLSEVKEYLKTVGSEKPNIISVTVAETYTEIVAPMCIPMVNFFSKNALVVVFCVDRFEAMPKSCRYLNQAKIKAGQEQYSVETKMRETKSDELKKVSDEILKIYE